MYDGWEHVLLDIDHNADVDVVMDARKLILWADTLPQFSAVYCSHNLEHYYLHDAVRVLQGMLAVLAPGGHVYIRVPDLAAVARAIVAGESLYDPAAHHGFNWHQCLYGDVTEVLRSGEHWAHKTGFTEEALKRLLESVGFVNCIFEHGGGYELAAMAFKPQEGTT